MTDASFVDRMGTDRVIDRVAQHRRVRRRVCNNFQLSWQRAMRPNPRINGGRWGAAEKAAVACLVGFAATCMLVVLLMGGR